MSHARNLLVAMITGLIAVVSAGAPTVGLSNHPQPRSSSSASADGDGWDVLDLIGEIAVVRRYTNGADRWEVWVCDLPHGQADIDAESAAETLGSELAPYFQWLSAGRYRPRFVAEGSARPTPGKDYPCAAEIEQRSTGVNNGALVLTDELNVPPAYAYPDTAPATGQSVPPGTFPLNRRVVRAGAHVALPEAWNFNVKIAAHEIGHALGWPHSYQGDTESNAQYNNPLDVMSADLHRSGRLEGRPQGTLAINRYAAGWIDPDQVTIHNSGVRTYRLGPVGADGLQLLVLPTGRLGSFVALDVRIDGGYDVGIKRDGVTVHTVDQSPESCPSPTRGGCFGHKRRTQPFLADNAVARDYAHVLTTGDSVRVDEYDIRVLDRRQDHFQVQITTTTHAGGRTTLAPHHRAAGLAPTQTPNPATDLQSATQPVAVAEPDVQIRTKWHRDLAEWAVHRYQTSELDLPALGLRSTTSTSPATATTASPATRATGSKST